MNELSIIDGLIKRGWKVIGRLLNFKKTILPAKEKAGAVLAVMRYWLK